MLGAPQLPSFPGVSPLASLHPSANACCHLPARFEMDNFSWEKKSTCPRPLFKSQILQASLRPRAHQPSPPENPKSSPGWALQADSYANLRGCINGSWLLIKSCLKVKYCWQP